MKWNRSFDPRSVGTLALWLDDQQAAGQWSAKLGANATQIATNNQPATSTIGNRPALSFDGINDSLALPIISMATWHAFAVINPTTADTKTVLNIAASGTQAFTLSSSATGLRVAVASGAPAAATATYGVDSRVGANWDGGALKNFYKGLLGEVLIYSGTLSSPQVTAVTRYLQAKWGI